MTDEERAKKIISDCPAYYGAMELDEQQLAADITAALSQARAEERERCARVADNCNATNLCNDNPECDGCCPRHIARAIRRGE
jgi:hypothetical protein